MLGWVKKMTWVEILVWVAWVYKILARVKKKACAASIELGLSWS